VPDDLTGFAIVAGACVLAAASLAIAVRVSKAFAGAISVLLAAAPLVGVILKAVG
jgi:hypothetical protein